MWLARDVAVAKLTAARRNFAAVSADIPHKGVRKSGVPNIIGVFVRGRVTHKAYNLPCRPPRHRIRPSGLRASNGPDMWCWTVRRHEPCSRMIVCIISKVPTNNQLPGLERRQKIQ